MRQGATATIILTVIDFDMSPMNNVWATFDQDGTQVVKKWVAGGENVGIMVNGQVVTVKLTQEETLGFDVGNVDVQIKAKEDDFDESTPIDEVMVTEIKKIKVKEGINKEII